MSLTYLGHCAFQFYVDGVRLYVDPYIQEPVDRRRLPPGDVVLYTHGHFDHGVLSAGLLYENWKCKFVAPKKLAEWMRRKYRRTIPPEAIIELGHGQKTTVAGIEILAVPAHHPFTRLGKTIHALYARTSAPGNPVNGYYFRGYYHSGDTVYTPEIARSLSGLDIHTACLPIGGKYKVANPTEALRIAAEIGARRIVPMHWQPLVEQVPARYQPSHLVKAAQTAKSVVEVCPLAIGEVLEPTGVPV